MKSNLHMHCMTEEQVQDFGINFGSWLYGLNMYMSENDIYREGESYLAIEPRMQLDYRQRATFHSSVLCGYEEKRLGR